MNNEQNYCRKVAEKIQALFSTGFEADMSTLHFINSTFDHPGHRALRSILNDAGNCDRDGLVDLIISPPLSLSLEIEALLTGTALTETAVTQISLLLPEELRTSIRVAGIKEPVYFVVPFACRQRFLSQLDLTRLIDADIRTVIEKHLPRKKDRLMCLAKIRHLRRIPARAWSDFLIRFIRVFDRVDKDKWFSDLDLILDMACRYSRENDVFTAFTLEKQHCLKQVEASLRLTKQLAGNNLETLMMQGNRIGIAADVSKLFQQLTIMDDICRLVLGEIPLIEEARFSGPEAVSFLFEKGSPQ